MELQTEIAAIIVATQPQAQVQKATVEWDIFAVEKLLTFFHRFWLWATGNGIADVGIKNLWTVWRVGGFSVAISILFAFLLVFARSI